MEEDDQSRSRNAKAQRRHREKRKAHLKSLEESVQLLTAQLEDARRQLGQSYAGSSRAQQPGMPGGAGGPPPISPNHKDYAQMQAENVYLRDENADLRRQLYAYRVSQPYAPGQPPPGPGQGMGMDNNTNGSNKPWDDVKPEHGDGNGFAYHGGGGSGMQGPPGGAGMSSASASASGSGQAPQMSPRVSVQERDGSMNDSGSNPSTSSGFPPMDHIARGNARSRVMSASSAPSASPYLPSPGFPTDPRNHSLSSAGTANSGGGGPGGGGVGGGGGQPGSNPQTPTDSRFPQMRYDHMYPPSGPPPHTLPRSGSGVYGLDIYNQGSGSGQGQGGGGSREGEAWGPESGPPPFPGPVSYSLSFQGHDQPSGDWRDAQQ